ncbi:MAG: hypothetical protein WD294_15020 [Phycisphaeraceae bacterium]
MSKRVNRKPRVPSYRRQKQNKQQDQAFVEINGKRHYLGTYGSPQSKAAYQRIIGEWLGGGGDLPPEPEHMLVAEILVRWVRWAQKHYRDRHGRQTTGYRNARNATRWLDEMFGEMYVVEFRPRHLKAIQRAMILRGFSRPYVNKNCDIIKAVFKWAVAEELVEPGALRGLEAVRGLQKGRTDAPETEPIKPVADDHVHVCLPHMPVPVAAMVRLQQATGMRPAEVVTIRPADIEMGSEVWSYIPDDHKLAHKDRDRIVFIGPKGQATLKAHLTPNRPTTKPIFSPRDAVADLHAKRHEQRQTPLKYGNGPGTNRSGDPQRSAGEGYSVDSYRRAIHRACDKAWPVPKGATAAEAKAHRDRHRWSPNQLRHTYATRVRRDHGLEAAQVLLGHSRADVTQVYAERDISKAREVAQLVG